MKLNGHAKLVLGIKERTGSFRVCYTLNLYVIYRLRHVVDFARACIIVPSVFSRFDPTSNVQDLYD